MSGIISGIDYSVLFPTPGSSTTNAASAILTALYSTPSGSGPSTAVSTGNPLTDLKLAQQNQTTGIAQEANQPQVAGAISAFQKAVARAKDIASALADPRVQQVLLTANGLSSYIGQTALVQKLFLSDPTDSKSLVSQLNNSTWTSTVQAYDFGSKGLAALQNPQVISALTSGYAEVQWRQSLDKATPGLSNALDFIANAGSITSAADVVNSTTNFDVITTALGIPQQIVNQDVGQVNATLNSRLDYTKFKDPAYVTSLTDQYLLTMQQNAAASSGTATDLTSLAVQAGGLLV